MLGIGVSGIGYKLTEINEGVSRDDILNQRKIKEEDVKDDKLVLLNIFRNETLFLASIDYDETVIETPLNDSQFIKDEEFNTNWSNTHLGVLEENHEILIECEWDGIYEYDPRKVQIVIGQDTYKYGLNPNLIVKEIRYDNKKPDRLGHSMMSSVGDFTPISFVNYQYVMNK